MPPVRLPCPDSYRPVVLAAALCALGMAFLPAAQAVTLAERKQAAEATASSGTNACSPLRPFYWEIGNRYMALDSGKVAALSDNGDYTGPQPDVALPIASASKWLYASYVVKTKGSALSQQDVAFLTFRSGYTQFTRCAKLATVGGCIAAQDGLPQDGSTEPDPGWGGSALVGSFDYSGAHMQKHASLNPVLRDLRNGALADEMNRVLKRPLGPDLGISYLQPQLAGGVSIAPAGYAEFLRQVLSSRLMPDYTLAWPNTCTNPNLPFVASATCLKQPTYSPFATGALELADVHYGLGHWIEDDVPGQAYIPYSSAGAFGFYPWVLADAKTGERTFYGIVVPKLPSLASMLDRAEGEPVQRPAQKSVACGRLIRQAWLTGVVQ